jgi:hypothetical protein
MKQVSVAVTLLCTPLWQHELPEPTIRQSLHCYTCLCVLRPVPVSASRRLFPKFQQTRLFRLISEHSQFPAHFAVGRSLVSLVAFKYSLLWNWAQSCTEPVIWSRRSRPDLLACGQHCTASAESDATWQWQVASAFVHLRNSARSKRIA